MCYVYVLYKKKINRIVHYLELSGDIIEKRVVKDYKYFTSSSKFDVIFPVDIYIGFESKMKVVEEKDKVYIGLDLTKYKCIEKNYEDALYKKFIYAIRFPISYPTLYDYLVSKNIDKDEALNNIYSIINLDLFKDALDYINNFCSNHKESIELKASEWPKLSDRRVLPILIIDKEDNTVNFTVSAGGTFTYRANRTIVHIHSKRFEEVIIPSMSKNIKEYCCMRLLNTDV